jgi:hypothetical protein
VHVRDHRGDRPSVKLRRRLVPERLRYDAGEVLGDASARLEALDQLLFQVQRPTDSHGCLLDQGRLYGNSRAVRWRAAAGGPGSRRRAIIVPAVGSG